MTKAEQDAALETLDDASIPLGNAFQRACEGAGLPPGSLNSFQIAAFNAIGLALEYVRNLPTKED